MTGLWISLQFSISESSLADVKATKCIYFFYICRWFVVLLLSLICKVIKNWCVNIYSVSIFIIARFQTSNSQVTQSETPQTRSPNPIVSTPVVHASSSQEISIDAETIQQHTYNFIGPYPYDCLPESFQWVPNGWKLEKKEKDVSFDEIFVGKIRSVTKISGKKGCRNVDLWGKGSTFKSELNYALSWLILAWVIFCSFHGSWVYLCNIISEKYQKKFYLQN